MPCLAPLSKRDIKKPCVRLAFGNLDIFRFQRLTDKFAADPALAVAGVYQLQFDQIGNVLLDEPDESAFLMGVLYAIFVTSDAVLANRSLGRVFRCQTVLVMP